MDSTVSVRSPWFHEAQQCHSGLHDSMRPPSVTMTPLVPSGPTGSQRSLHTLRPNITQPRPCNGSSHSQYDPSHSQSLSIYPCYPQHVPTHSHFFLVASSMTLVSQNYPESPSVQLQVFPVAPSCSRCSQLPPALFKLPSACYFSLPV